MSYRPLKLARKLGPGILFALVFGTAHGDQPQGVEQMRAFAKALLVREEYPSAVEAYLTIAQQMPEDARAHYEYAGTLGFLRMFEEAAPAIERAIELDPQNTLYWEFAAITFQQLRDDGRAFAATEHGAQLGDVNAMYSLAGLYEHGRGTQMSDEKALHWLERAATAGHLSAMDAMRRVYTQGLYQQLRDPARAAQWDERLRREEGRE